MLEEATRDLTDSQYLHGLAGYQKATRKGKRSKQRFEVTPGIYLETFLAP